MSKRIKIEKLAETKFRLIAIPAEKVLIPGQVEEIEHNNQVYEVSDYYSLQREEIYPQGFIMLAMGVNIPAKKLWQKYPRSKLIYFFISKLKE